MDFATIKRRLAELLAPPQVELLTSAQLERHTQLGFFTLLAGFVFVPSVVFGVMRWVQGELPLLVTINGVSALLSLGCWLWALHSGNARGPMWVLGVPTVLVLSWLTLRQGDGIPAAGWWLGILPFVFAGGGFNRMALLAMTAFLGVTGLLFFGPPPESLGITADPGVTRESHIASVMMSELLAVVLLASVIHRRITSAAALDAAREKAMEAATAKTRFLANMSHEIRTPLNGVIGAAELMRSARITDAQRVQLQALQEQSAQALLALVNDVLDFAKLEAGKVDIEVEPLFLRGLVFQANELFAVQAFNKGLELSSSRAPDVPKMVIGDATRIRQVVNNLVSNAVKFTETGGVHIHLSLEPQTGRNRLPAGRRWVRVDVTDTGPGIAPETLSRLFNAFTQADQSVSRRYGGTGLGLVISQELARLMDGEVTVDSTPGEGSTFSLRLPMTLVPAAEREAPHSIVSRPDVVVVAANAGLRQHLIWLFNELGIQPAVAEALPEDDAALAGSLLLVIDAPLLFAVKDPQAWVAGQHARRRHVAILTPLGSDAMVGVPDGAMLLYKPVRRRTLRDALAAADERAAAAVAPPAGAEELQPGAMTVLVVEDNPVNQMVVQAMLGELGVNCAIANDGAEGLVRLQDGGFDLVLMDVQMPGMDGLAATRALRRDEAARGSARMPVIAMTANSEIAEKDACMAAGMDDFLSKPFGIAQLRRCLRRWKPRGADVASPAVPGGERG